MNASRLNRRLVTGLALTLAGATVAHAQTPWNRSVQAVAVTPDATGGTQIVVYYAVDAEEPSAPLNLATEMTVLVNGTAIAVQEFPVVVNPGTFGGCGTMCLSNQACFCCEVGGETICGCGSWIAPSEPIPTPLRPEDEIMVLLRPAAGALPDDDQSDDILVLTYHDQPIVWNRKLASVEARAGDQFFDVWIELETSANFDGRLRLGAELDVLINGELFGTFDAGIDDLTWGQCTGDGCGTDACAWFGDGGVAGTCAFVDEWDDCGCDAGNGNPPLVIQAVPAEPGDELTIILRPVPGALPELPGFPEDDEDTMRLCPADLDGNGLVDFGDILAILGAWGPCEGCPEDLDQSGTVDFGDILAVLAAWGPCEPV